ncbi:expressed unknown protein [Seminavis robusta]|uniref:Uncharacterized protein n=1 Tax=Seminavis robusta TaxID=568900 RepID=A0A9N8EZ42_9STRA|nr:expressed unknown protein [Seminavis robusta]|eukprot:Sro2609_g332510.1 n/a (103) ;mRNA; f:11592-11900
MSPKIESPRVSAAADASQGRRDDFHFEEEEYWFDGDYDYDDYAEYDDFQACQRGGGGGSKVSQKNAKRQTQRGGGGGAGTIYSSKHIRAKENLRTTAPKRNK